PDQTGTRTGPCILEGMTARHAFAVVVLKQERSAGGEVLVEISRDECLKIGAGAEPLAAVRAAGARFAEQPLPDPRGRDINLLPGVRSGAISKVPLLSWFIVWLLASLLTAT